MPYTSSWADYTPEQLRLDFQLRANAVPRYGHPMFERMLAGMAQAVAHNDAVAREKGLFPRMRLTPAERDEAAMRAFLAQLDAEDLAR